MSLSIVVTTIQPPTPAMHQLATRAREAGATLICVGDRKGPATFDLPGSQLLSLADQLASPFEIATVLPVGHYARKNIGYLYAIAHGATSIYETDDDNAPLRHWQPRCRSVDAIPIRGDGWHNVYQNFTDDHVWPRGLPLDAISHQTGFSSGLRGTVDAPIQQGLANNSPDVDAVWRLVQNRPVEFRDHASVWLSPGCWCPFNSQSTWWFEEAWPLLYLPSYCSFRMTDIWRSLIAQRCLWASGYGVVFHGAEVVQKRNEHNLLKDFEDEIPGYLSNRRIAEVLEETDLAPGREAVATNLLRCYERLVDSKFVDERELALLGAWLQDLGRLAKG